MAAAERVELHTFTRMRLARLSVATIFFINGVMIANWFARLPDVKLRLGISEGTLGFALLASAVGALLAQVAAGWAIGRFGSRAVTIFMGVAFGLMQVLLGQAATLPLLVLALFVLGACNGGLDVAMNAQAALVEQAYGRPIMSSFHALWSVGGLVGAGVGGLAAARGFGLGLHFTLASAVGLGIVLLAIRGLVRDGATRASHEAAFVLPPRALVPMGIVAFCALVSEGAIGDWGAIYLREVLAASAGLAATGYAVFALMMAGGRFSGDWLTTRIGSAKLVRGSGVLVVLGILIALAGSAPWLAIAGFALVGAGVSCIFPLIMSVAARTPGVAPGTGIAAMATAGYTGFLVGPPLIGTLAEQLTLRGALGVLVLCGVTIVVLGASVKLRA